MEQNPCNDVTSRISSKRNFLLNHIENGVMDSPSTSDVSCDQKEQPAKRVRFNCTTKYSGIRNVVQPDKRTNSEVLHLNSASTPGVSSDEKEQPAKRVRFNCTTKYSEIQNVEQPVKRTNKKIDPPNSQRTIAIVEFNENEVVWAKLKGHPYWPARIVSFEKNKFEIFWFNDYRKSKVFRTQLLKFNQTNFEEYSKTKKIGFEAAVKEAILYGMYSFLNNSR